MSDISSLRQSFKGDIVTPGDANYKEAIARWAANTERPARIVAFVKDTTDVPLALKYARDNNLQVAIRCGGHSPSGSSSAEDGLVVDLSRYFNYAVVDPERRTVRVGGGTLWDTVEKESIKHELATVCGAVNHTGVSGLLLGGGHGYLTGQHGLTIDNLLQATIVTANGTTLTLSDTDNPDLFWGIRGGGSNFGICTEFVLQLHPQRPTVFAGMVVYSTDVLRELMAVLARWWKCAKNHEGITIILSKDPLSGKECIALILFYNGSEKDGRESFRDFFDLKPVFDNAKEIPFEKLNSLTNDGFPHGGNYYMKSAFQSNPRFDVINAVLEKLIELNAAPGNEIDHAYMFEYTPQRTVLTRRDDATAHIRSHRNMTGCVLKWPNNTPSVAQAAKRAAAELVDIVAKAEAQVSGTDINSGYGNLNSETQAESIAPDTAGPARSLDDSNSRVLFGSNYARLQRLKAQYDPENVFFRWFAITPNPNAGL
ncbi:hypothetical protein EDB85DRAFT_2143531 [Lactarius pseudohatsudake]|nr:hypothetical protein EDB85DRAFT_2143531 [Lactarius pseudohatsudake]